MEKKGEQQFISGFNSGYILTKYRPELSVAILSSLETTNDFIEGFSAGKSELESEQSKALLRDLHMRRQNSKEYGKDREA